MRDEELEWTPHEMYELLKAGLIMLGEFDMEWVNEETTVFLKDYPIIEPPLIHIEKQSRGRPVNIIELPPAYILPELKPVRLGKLSRVRLAKLNRVRLAKLNRVRLAKLNRVRLDKLRVVNLNKLTPVTLGKLSAINLTKLRPVSIEKLQRVSLIKLRSVHLNRLQAVNLNKLQKVNLGKPKVQEKERVLELKPIRLDKLFVDLTKVERVNLGKPDVNVKEIKENAESIEKVEAVIKPIVKTRGQSNSISSENVTENLDSVVNSDTTESKENNKGVSEQVQVNNTREFEDTSYAKSKGALVMDWSDDEDTQSEEELLREEQLIKQRELREQEKAQRLQEFEEQQAIQNKKSSKKLKILLISVLFVVLGTIIFLVLWNNQGGSTNAKIEEIVNSVEKKEEPVTVKTDDGGTEQLNFMFLSLEELKARNSDTVAWLKSDELKLDYPIVQSFDNEFYLNHDIDKKSSSVGWLFMDCTNSTETLGFHTIIYGHNRRDRVAFGNLKALLEDGASSRQGIDRLYFTTANTAYILEICSVFIADYTEELIFKTSFDSSVDKQAFIDELNARNIIPEFKRDKLSVNDNIVSFSTCHGASGTSKRLTVHCRVLYKTPNL